VVVFNKEFKRMLFKDSRNRVVLKLLQLVEDGKSLGALHDIEEILKKDKVQYELLGGKNE